MKRPRRVVRDKNGPAITINIQSWATPIVGIIMLVIGLFGGYYGGRPAGKDVNEQSVVPQLNEPAPIAETVAENAYKMDDLVSQVRHFKGDPDAPVTLVEFGDFQ